MTTESPKLYALLIGINFYYPNLLSNGARYGNLDGAVNDIDRVEQFLNRQPQKPDRIYKLTATPAETRSTLDRPTANETEANLPTYANIIKSFNDLTEEAKAGDKVYIHYSGHGGRATSIYPKNIKSNGIDEALVPTDIGFDDGRYIRDLELAVLLKRMVDKGLIVTLILDSCHSGGSTRGNNVKIRGLSKDAIDRTYRPTTSLVNPTEAEITAVASGWTNPKYATRGGTPVATMIPEVNGYVLLAACRPSEFAYECAFDESGESNGSLTYWLLDTLNQPFPSITYQMIYDRLSSKINTQFPTQNPMILGEGDRVFLSQDYKATPFTVNVRDVRLDENKVLLDAGQAQGVRKGSEFVIYPARSLSFEDKSQRIAIALLPLSQLKYLVFF